MNKSIASIDWPDSAHERMRLLLLYMSKVIEEMDISFGSPPNDPMAVIKGLLGDKQSEQDRRSALSYWWNIIEKEGIRDLSNRSTLIARLAVCPLSPNEEDASDLGEQLSWFLEVLGFLGADVDKAILVMEQHFHLLMFNGDASRVLIWLPGSMEMNELFSIVICGILFECKWPNTMLVPR